MSTELILPGQSDGTEWRNRIVGEGTEAPDQLMVNPQNWRTHPQFQQDVLSSVLDEVGWIQEVIVNKTTGHLIDGHLRVTLAIQHGEKEIPVKYVEMTPDEEALVLTTLDPIAGLAIADDEKLRELMAEIQSDDAAIQAMMDELAYDLPIIDDGDLAGKHSDRTKPTGSNIVVGFGSFAGLVQASMVDQAIEAIKKMHGVDPGIAMTLVCEKLINESSSG